MEALLQATGGKVPDTMEVVGGAGRPAGRPALLPGAARGRDHRPRPQERARRVDPQTNAPAVSFILNPPGPRSSSARPAATSGSGSRSSSTAAWPRRPRSRARSPTEGRITGRFTDRRRPTSSPRCCARARCPPRLKLPPGAHGRRPPGQGLDSRRGLASAAGMAFLTLFMLLYYRLSGLNAVVALRPTCVILLGAMAYFGRDPDAARHRRRDPDDRRGRRHQRARLRAHPRGAPQRQGACAWRSATASSGCGSRSSTPTPPR